MTLSEIILFPLAHRVVTEAEIAAYALAIAELNLARAKAPKTSKRVKRT